MNSMLPENRKLAKIDRRSEELLHKRLTSYLQLRQKKKNSQNESDQIYCYLVSKRYLKQWEQYCSVKGEQRYEPQQMNFDLIDENGQLKRGLMEVDNFEILSQEIYNIIKEPTRHEFKRKIMKVGKENKIPIYLEKIQYVKITHQDFKQTSKTPSMKKVEVWKEDDVKGLINNIKQAQGIDKNENVRIWRSKDQSFTKVWQRFREQQKKQPIVKGRGTLIQSLDQKISNLRLQENDYFIVQVKDQLGNWVLFSPKKGKCQGCYHQGVMQIQCKCKQVSYCNKECQQRDKRYHQNRCTYQQQENEIEPIKMQLTAGSLKGRVGLSNLGNTCFMNSCLQCLSNTVPLTQYFLAGLYQKQINMKNPLGSKGRIARNYARFIQNMWCQSSSTYSPSQLKRAVGQKNQMFLGYSQHDSHQFFSSIVDYIHEDLNRVKKKLYVEQVESKGRKDNIVAFESWQAYLKRNQSIIVDLMTGQYKSIVNCPQCKQQSITFDPFTTVSLPLQIRTKRLKYFIIYKNCSKKAEEMTVSYRYFDKKQLLSNATQLLRRQPSQFVFYILTKQDIYSFESNNEKTILSKIEEGQKVFLLQLTKQQKELQEKIQIVTKFTREEYDDNLWLKRPYFFGKNATVKTIRQRINEQLKSIYNPKNNGPFDKKILEKSLFTLVLQCGKKKQSSYYHWKQTIKFSKKFILDDDSASIQKMSGEFKLSDCELNVIFTYQNAKLFEFGQWGQWSPKHGKHQEADEGQITLQSCFDYFELPEKLEQGNQWYCPKCQKHQLALKTMSIYKAPQILILHLKRFKSVGRFSREKNQREVKFPQVLNLAKYIVDPRPMSSYFNELENKPFFVKPPYPIESSSQNCQFELYATSNHFGSLGGGHYTASAKNGGKWFYYNDSSVGPTSQDRQSSAAYVLFYKRKR